MKGGYKIVSLKGRNFVLGTAQTVGGIYDEIESNYNKELIVEGFSVGGVDINAYPVTAKSSATVLTVNYFYITAGNYNIAIGDNDSVVVSCTVYDCVEVTGTKYTINGVASTAANFADLRTVMLADFDAGRAIIRIKRTAWGGFCHAIVDNSGTFCTIYNNNLTATPVVITLNSNGSIS